MESESASAKARAEGGKEGGGQGEDDSDSEGYDTRCGCGRSTAMVTREAYRSDCTTRTIMHVIWSLLQAGATRQGGERRRRQGWGAGDVDVAG